ncbi:hypothetical protein Taro_043461, partial [Colocasia esculenta]|nr:hypothetical protein [Colocasia esculenta]
LLYGNNFQGPIPPSFLNLSNLIDLRLGDITDGSSALTFIQNMKYLRILVLRNCKISGTILHNFDEYRSLTFLDLSFNNLTGQLPQSLFVSNSLKYLFLGNNSLSGSLPMAKGQTLTNLWKQLYYQAKIFYAEFIHVHCQKCSCGTHRISFVILERR